jgi:hypothetical protein
MKNHENDDTTVEVANATQLKNEPKTKAVATQGKTVPKEKRHDAVCPVQMFPAFVFFES